MLATSDGSLVPILSYQFPVSLIYKPVQMSVKQHMHTPLQADPDPKVRERCAYRHSLLMGYTSSIPAVLRQLPTQPEERRRDTLKTTGMYMATKMAGGCSWNFQTWSRYVPTPPHSYPSLPSLLCFLPFPHSLLPFLFLLPCSISSSLPYSHLPSPFPSLFSSIFPSLPLSPFHPQWILASLSRPSWQRSG